MSDADLLREVMDLRRERDRRQVVGAQLLSDNSLCLRLAQLGFSVTMIGQGWCVTPGDPYDRKSFFLAGRGPSVADAAKDCALKMQRAAVELAAELVA